MSTLKELEDRVKALEERGEKEIMCLREGGYQMGHVMYAVADEHISGYQPGHEKFFSVRSIVIALAKKAGLKIVYHYPVGERVEYK